MEQPPQRSGGDNNPGYQASNHSDFRHGHLRLGRLGFRRLLQHRQTFHRADQLVLPGLASFAHTWSPQVPPYGTTGGNAAVSTFSLGDPSRPPARAWPYGKRRMRRIIAYGAGLIASPP